MSPTRSLPAPAIRLADDNASRREIGQPTPVPSAAERDPIDSPAMTGLASYYADRFHGRLTASGERFDMHAHTAAHRTLPFGTHVRVTHLASGRSTTVRINDRGPFIDGRIIDLSLAAAEELNMLDEGVASVRLTILPPPTGPLTISH